MIGRYREINYSLAMDGLTGQVKRLLRSIRSVRGRLTPPRWSAAGRWSKLPHGSVGLVTVLMIAAVIALAAIVCLPPLFSPELDDPQAQFEVRDQARLTVSAIIAGAVILFGTYINWRRMNALEDQVTMVGRGQITDRFTRAIDQLGAVRANDAPAPEIRAGGVRSLERIAGESPDDLWPILDILTAYLRSESPWRPPDVVTIEFARRALDIQHRMDVASTVEAIERLWPGGGETIRAPLNLAHTHVLGIDLSEKCLEGAKLTGANLTRAKLMRADLSDADLVRARLTGANLTCANLTGADLPLVDLTGAKLGGAILDGAIVNAVVYDQSTRWPEGFTPPRK